MAKSNRSVEMIRGKEPMLRQIVCEARYFDGQLYLDHRGRLLRKLVREMPGWVVAPEPTPQSTTLYNMVTGTQLAFGRESASLSLDRSSVDDLIDTGEATDFVHQVDAVLALVLDELEVTAFRRIGYREYYHFSFNTREESERWLQELALVTISPALFAAFQGVREALGVAIVVQSKECRYRIGLNGIERPAQILVGETVLTVRASAAAPQQRELLAQVVGQNRRRPIQSPFVAVLDVDAYLLDPVETSVAAFARQQSGALLPLFRKALVAESSGKRKGP
jgi:hypothetical protein